MKRPFKKAAAFITAIVTALTMGAVPASAASAKAPQIVTVVSPKYDMAFGTGSSVVLVNSNYSKKNASFVVVGPSGKAYKRKNTVGFNNFIKSFDYSGNSYFHDLKPGNAISDSGGWQGEDLLVENDKGKRYILLNNGKFVEYDNTMFYQYHFYAKRNGEDTITYYGYNGKKIITVKNQEYGEFDYSLCQYGFMGFKKYDPDKKISTVTFAYGGKVVKTFKAIPHKTSRLESAKVV